MEISYRATPESVAALKQALDRFTIDVQDKIQRKALRDFTRAEVAKIRAARGAAYAASSRHLTGKVKIWKSGIVWASVGDRTITGRSTANSPENRNVGGRARRAIYDAEGLGWRTHFNELGFHTYPRGRPHTGTGRGWKKGIRHRNAGGYHRGTRASELVHRSFGPQVHEYLARAVQEEIARRTR